MEVICNDPVFGKMHYKHRWYKQENVSLFGQNWDITIAAKAYSGKSITMSQRTSYQWFKDHLSEIDAQAAEMIIIYINVNGADLAATWSGARVVSKPKELYGIVVPTSLLIKQDGTMLILLECKWDEERGLAVQIIPSYAIGSQDAFL